MIDRGVLLAAGKGTRLGALTASFPKPMLEVAGRPILFHILSGLARAGLVEAVVVTGHCAELLEAALGDGSALGLRARTVRQGRPEGTARAILLGKSLLGERPFFFGWGDILVEPSNYGRVLAAFDGTVDAVIAVNDVPDPFAGGAVYVDERGLVTKIVEKPARGSSTTRWNNSGLGVLSPSLWPRLEALPPSPRGEYELPQALGQLVAEGGRVRAVPVEGAWFDIGTPEDLADARARFPRG
jgi:UDP-N-acetylglucosamine diphosphorylase / glucose-1-phosphate thymidylyltransferase / UDP-N-acetylgalactosamine diphosphorylase / glucosamine-1-phosphate N-acetyltransferase / galactosamine-1-phosphate N-acetyltransferase